MRWLASAASFLNTFKFILIEYTNSKGYTAFMGPHDGATQIWADPRKEYISNILKDDDCLVTCTYYVFQRFYILLINWVKIRSSIINEYKSIIHCQDVDFTVAIGLGFEVLVQILVILKLAQDRPG